MKILLPPSETKRPGGTGAPLDVDALALPALTPQRERVIAAVIALSEDPEQAMRVLKLSPRQAGDVESNRLLRAAVTMPAIDRYTGVLYDALDAASLDASARRRAGTRVWIHSALLGPIGALDALPAYRLAAGASLPGLPALRRLWADATTSAIAEEDPGFVLDLRSEAYAALGPLPGTIAHVYVRVVAAAEGGTRALNHFNKRSKGLLTRALLETGKGIGSEQELYRWARDAGFVMRPSAAPGECELVVPD